MSGPPETTLPTLTCTRCGATWTPRRSRPSKCAKCHSPYWWVARGVLPSGWSAYWGQKRAEAREGPPEPPGATTAPSTP